MKLPLLTAKRSLKTGYFWLVAATKARCVSVDLDFLAVAVVPSSCSYMKAVRVNQSAIDEAIASAHNDVQRLWYGIADRAPVRNAEARARFEPRLRGEFQIASAFIPLRMVAKVLGFAPSTLNEYVRESRFFMPCAKLSRIRMVAEADMVERYYLDSDALPPASSTIPQRREARRGSHKRSSAAKLRV